MTAMTLEDLTHTAAPDYVKQIKQLLIVQQEKQFQSNIV